MCQTRYYLICNSLGFNPFDYGAKDITQFELTTYSNKNVKADLPLGGFGMSRYEMDFQLYELALKCGVEVLHHKVIDVMFEANRFQVEIDNKQQFQSKIVIGAFGKRSNLDIQFQRKFIISKITLPSRKDACVRKIS